MFCRFRKRDTSGRHQKHWRKKESKGCNHFYSNIRRYVGGLEFVRQNFHGVRKRLLVGVFFPKFQKHRLSPCRNEETVGCLQKIVVLKSKYRRYQNNCIAPYKWHCPKNRFLPGLKSSCFPNQNMDNPVSDVSFSRACIPSFELPFLFSPGDQVATENLPGNSATMPPPTPLLPGRPTSKANSPASS